MLQIAKFLRFYFKFVPPLMLALVLWAPIDGALRPWPPGDTLISEMSDDTALMVGGSNQKSCLQSDDQSWKCDTLIERQYILVPSFLSQPSITTVTQRNSETPTASVSSTSFGLGVLATLAFCAFATWFVWLRPNRAQVR